MLAGTQVELLDKTKKPLLNFVVDIITTRGSKKEILRPLIRLLGSFTASNDDSLCDAVLKAGGMSAWRRVLELNIDAISKECWWALSNVVAGTPDQQSAFVKDVEMLERLRDDLLHGAPAVVKECLYIFSNALDGGSAETIRCFAACGVIKAGRIVLHRGMGFPADLLATAASVIKTVEAFFERHSDTPGLAGELEPLTEEEERMGGKPRARQAGQDDADGGAEADDDDDDGEDENDDDDDDDDDDDEDDDGDEGEQKPHVVLV
jgi:hypothetical protein